jgi:hypothetical protein
VAWVHEAIAADRKVGALKQLQGHVWRSGFKKGQLTAELFRWVTVCAVDVAGCVHTTRYSRHWCGCARALCRIGGRCIWTDWQQHDLMKILLALTC